ncbi:TolC family protein [Pseudozobellia thermophila]|uniref:Outer membrane protein TolC n=1 Tax=Pseudozobellia thermophila TaxID=192903 RepID=A0A1M6GM34_9FLAO|nr:TolC family protein [Pseudozobellia thermophila]SHJ10946.1 Outer membrane protein TolC [Pseudozobellia thermophila]
MIKFKLQDIVARKMHLLAFLGMLILGLQTVSAQEGISLEESKKAALKHSNAIKNGLLTIEKAKAFKQEMLANYFPTIEATALGLYGPDDIISPIPGILPNGIDNLYSASAMATEVIYAGGKIRNSNALADLQTETSKIRAEQAVDSVLLVTEQKFWQLVQLQEQQKVLETNEAYLNELLKQQEDLLEAGLIAKNQLLQVKVNRSELLLNKSKLENLRKLALLDFSLYVGVAYSPEMRAMADFENIAPPELKYTEPDLNLTENSNYQLLEKSISASQLRTKMAKADLLPSLAVGFSAFEFGSFDNTLASQFSGLAFGTLSIPISDWWGGGKQRVRQEKIQQEISQNNREDGIDQLKVAITQSWYDLLDAHEQIQYALENKALAEENLKVYRDNYDSGLSNLTDLLDAQAMAQKAQSNLINAYTNYQNKEITFLYRTDQLDTPAIEGLK